MKQKIHLSVLDLCPILSGKSARQSLTYSAELAAFVEDLGFERYWIAEHHDMPGIGSSAPEVLIGFIAGATKKIRVGSGGIMLPNHATLHVAEAFKTLAALYPGRIDLGLGRAPGSGSRASLYLRGSKHQNVDDFPEQVRLLDSFLRDEGPVSAIPTEVLSPEIWMLGSSDFGARLAGEKGLPYAFAQHFSHLPALEVIQLYYEFFKPSARLSGPKAMLGIHVICADTDQEAQDLALSTELSFSLFVQSGKSIPLPTLAEARAYPYSESDWKTVRAGSFPKFVGSPETIKRQLSPYIEAGVHEFVVLCMVHDQDARKKSYQLLQKALS